ncbi:zinc finger MYM-type protein 1 [Artemisia annua]|uniref:Zinc finger MYM-type protein 1 n=1 Tax=Artemisia annua TaxID=35608 RepID=A0A2U1LKW5_ARTAN|nr:zinc finger MYM-type protein 1 [Artemisia annua]
MEEKPNVHQGANAFIVGGFDKWKKVNDGNRCAFLKHISCLQHKNAIALGENFLNQATHIGNILEKQSVETVRMNRLRLKASVDIVRWLTFQTCAFRGHDESKKSKNQESKRTKASIDEPDEFRNQQEPPISENPRTSNMKPNVHQGADAFIVGGFDKWKTVNDGNRCAFLKHISCLQHKNAIALGENLLNQATHIGNILEKQSVETVRMNCLRLKASVDILCLLAEKYYPTDFKQQERLRLRHELELFPIEMKNNPKLSDASTIVELCTRLVETDKRETLKKKLLKSLIRTK